MTEQAVTSASSGTMPAAAPATRKYDNSNSIFLDEATTGKFKSGLTVIQGKALIDGNMTPVNVAVYITVKTRKKDGAEFGNASGKSVVIEMYDASENNNAAVKLIKPKFIEDKK